jgi:hypothetical protein
MKLLLWLRIRACLLHCARSDSSTYWSKPAASLHVRLWNPSVARLAGMFVCAVSLQTFMNNPG